MFFNINFYLFCFQTDSISSCFISANPRTQLVNLNSSFERKQPNAIIIHSDENEKNKKSGSVSTASDRNYSCLKREILRRIFFRSSFPNFLEIAL